MTMFEKRPALRWIAPLAVVAVVGGTGMLATTASAGPTLAPKSAEQLLVDVQQAKVDGLSGTVVQTADLGLPALPTGGSAAASELTSLLSGNHTLKVWAAGPDKLRVAVLDRMAETDVVVNGSDVWTYASQTNEATHRTLPKPSARPGRPRPPHPTCRRRRRRPPRRCWPRSGRPPTSRPTRPRRSPAARPTSSS